MVVAATAALVWRMQRVSKGITNWASIPAVTARRAKATGGDSAAPTEYQSSGVIAMTVINPD